MKIEDLKTVVDSERGCGWRKEGGLYLRADGPMDTCGKLPVPLEVCPCCHSGVKQARGWTWFDPRPFLAVKVCSYAERPGDDRALKCLTCPMQHPPERAGLLWVGEKFYATPAEYMDEARRLGISRRIAAVPADFKIGDRVYLAHPRAIKELCVCRQTLAEKCPTCEGEGWVYKKGIFTTFIPDRIEYVCKGDETEEQLDALCKRNITPVKVIRDTDQKPQNAPPAAPEGSQSDSKPERGQP